MELILADLETVEKRLQKSEKSKRGGDKEAILEVEVFSAIKAVLSAGKAAETVSANLEQEKKKVPKLPLWLSPTQVRLIPLSEKFLDDVEIIAKEFEKEKIRADIDDRSDTVQKKIRDAELEWVPYILVIGPKEIESQKLSVRIRETGKIEQIKLKELVGKIEDETKDKPFKKLSLPKLLSKRPIFVG